MTTVYIFNLLVGILAGVASGLTIVVLWPKEDLKKPTKLINNHPRKAENAVYARNDEIIAEEEDSKED